MASNEELRERIGMLLDNPPEPHNIPAALAWGAVADKLLRDCLDALGEPPAGSSATPGSQPNAEERFRVAIDCMLAAFQQRPDVRSALRSALESAHAAGRRAGDGELREALKEAAQRYETLNASRHALIITIGEIAERHRLAAPGHLSLLRAIGERLAALAATEREGKP